MHRSNHNYPITKTITITQAQKQSHNDQLFMYYFNIPKSKMSGSPFFQKTSVKKNQNRFHQSKTQQQQHRKRI